MFGALIVICGFLAVNALENVALGKPTYQTDDYEGKTSDKAVDGHTGTAINGGTLPCTHTSSSTNAWWEVDLGQVCRIDHVIVFGRTDCCVRRLRDVQLFISYNRSDDDYVLRSFHDGILPTPQYTFQLTQPVYGRWMKITRPSTVNASNDQLTLCEVQVMGDEMTSKVKFEFGDGQIGTGVVLKSSEARTKTECCVKCKMSGTCSAVNYNYVTKVCEELETVTTIEDFSSDSYFYRLP